MEPTIEVAPIIELEPALELDLTHIVLGEDRRLGLRQRLEGRRLEGDAVEIDLRAIAQERLALTPERRHR